MGTIGRTQQLGTVHDASRSAGEDLFPSPIKTPDHPTRVTLSAAFDTPGILTLKRIGPNATTTQQLFGGAELEAEKLHPFTFDLARDQDFNLTYSFDTQVLVLLATREV